MQSAGRVKEVEASLAAARAEKLEAVVSAVHTQTGGGDMTSAETSSASTWRKLEEEREAQLDGALVALKEVDRLQNTVMHCSTLQYAATYCNMLQDAAAQSKSATVGPRKALLHAPLAALREIHTL